MIACGTDPAVPNLSPLIISADVSSDETDSANTSKVMVDAKGQGNLLYLPLDKLMQATAGATAANAAYAADAIQLAAPAGSNAVSSAPTAHTESPPQTEKAPAVERGSDGRSRDGLRSRDRGER